MMNYTRTASLSAEHFDIHGNLLPAHVLYLAQQAADEHATALGVGFERMLEQKLLWVVTQVRYQVCQPLFPGETVTVTTWPLPPTKLGFERNFLICDSQGNIRIRGLSNWVMIDTEKRHFVIPQDLYPNADYCMERTFPDRARRLRDFQTDQVPTMYDPDRTTIDQNGHVNNTQYARFILEVLGDFGGVIDTFQIDYMHEVLCHQPLTLFHKKENNQILIKGLLEGETRSFTATITLCA